MAIFRQLWDFDEVEQLFLSEWFLQDGPTRNESDKLLSIFLVNALHQFHAVHAFVLYVSQHKIKRTVLTVASIRFVSVGLCHDQVASPLKHGHHHFLHCRFVFH